MVRGLFSLKSDYLVPIWLLEKFFELGLIYFHQKLRSMLGTQMSPLDNVPPPSQILDPPMLR